MAALLTRIGVAKRFWPAGLNDYPTGLWGRVPRRPRSLAEFKAWRDEAILTAIDYELAWWAGGELREVRRVPVSQVERFKSALLQAGERNLADRLEADIARAFAGLPEDPAVVARRNALGRAFSSAASAARSVSIAPSDEARKGSDGAADGAGNTGRDKKRRR